MSVLKNDRQESSVQFLENAYELQVAVYKLVVKFPKRYSFIIGNPIAKLAMDCHMNTKYANSIYPTNKHEYQLRRDYINKAIGNCQNLSSQMDIALNLFSAEINGFKAVLPLIRDQLRLLKGLKESDKKRFKTILE